MRTLANYGALDTVVTMPYEDQIGSMKACIEWFDSIGYTGPGREGLMRCIAAFESEGKEAAIAEYRRLIGAAANLLRR